MDRSKIQQQQLIRHTGENRIKQLADNAKYFRQTLKSMGFIVFGNDASPIVPLLLFMFPKIPFVVIYIISLTCYQFDISCLLSFFWVAR